MNLFIVFLSILTMINIGDDSISNTNRNTSTVKSTQWSNVFQLLSLLSMSSYPTVTFSIPKVTICEGR